MASQLTPVPPAAYNTLATIPKSNTFTSKLPPDPAFETPKQSHDAPRETLGPRIVKGAMYTYVRPETAEEPELLGVSPRAMEDLGLQPGEEKTEDFVSLVAGNKILWNEEEGESILGRNAMEVHTHAIVVFSSKKSEANTVQDGNC